VALFGALTYPLLHKLKALSDGDKKAKSKQDQEEGARDQEKDFSGAVRETIGTFVVVVELSIATAVNCHMDSCLLARILAANSD